MEVTPDACIVTLLVDGERKGFISLVQESDKRNE